MTGARCRAVMAASQQGERDRQRYRRLGRPQTCSGGWQTCSSGMRVGDYPPLRAPGTGLDHAIQRILSKRRKAATACSSDVRFGEFSPICVSEGGLQQKSPWLLSAEFPLVGGSAL